MPRSYLRPRRGAVTVWMVLCLVALLGAVALGTDGGRLLQERQHTQTAADAAALAAAGVLYQQYSTANGLDPSGTAAAAARQLAQANGIANDGTTSTVTVNIPPQQGSFVGKAGYAEVIVHEQIPASFSGIFGWRTLTVTARSVARGIQIGPASSGGVYVMQPSGNNAVKDTGNTNVTLINGSLYVNSNGNNSVSVAGSSTYTAKSFEFVGGYGPATFNGPVHQPVPPKPDPLAKLPVPDPSTYPIQSLTAVTVTGARTLNPGVYRGGISVESTGTLTLNPGVYILVGGGIQVTGGTVQGNGVMLNNVGSTPGTSGTISFSGTSTVNLTPPSGGAYAGISVFQDRNSSQTVNIEGNHNKSITGAIYALSAEVDLSGPSTSGQMDVLGGMVVGYNMQFRGMLQVGGGGGVSATSLYGLVE